ncbi:MAG: NADH:ubiquinone reductase (Na(+)-transporting) subunit C [Vicingaceae bacterium]|nr:NADH:ubiquinone reductase (Na(+)-transporting) subunit C [Vicingaceae bacterium]
MDVNSNKYTIGFSLIMVVIVALILAFTSESLKPMQKKNVELEKMQNILQSVGVSVSRDEAEANFNQFITEQIVLDLNGQKVEGDAFNIDVLKEYKSGGQKNFPIFVYENKGSRKFIIPLVGKGLWGPIWGYIALDEDKNTVAGASFDHKTETPGLGAEINQGWFQAPFVGKKVFDETGTYKSITVIKGGAKDSDLHGVDAISGGTITSNGVTEMLIRTLKVYEPFLKS